MDKNIFFIDILKNDVYIEFVNRESQYISFTKAKRVIFGTATPMFAYSCCDSEKSVAFLNSLLTRYKAHDSQLTLRR